MITQRIKTNGTELQVYEYSHAGEPILFLHPGALEGALVWHAVVPYFTDRFRVLAIDMRGHGESEQTETGYDLWNLAKDIEGVLDVLNIDNVHLVGNSLGSEVGICFAATYPDRVLSFTTVDGVMLNLIGPNGEREESKEEIVAGRLNRTFYEYESHEEFIKKQRVEWQPWNEVREVIVNHAKLRPLANGRFSDIVNPRCIAQEIASFCDIQLEEVYPRLRCPVLFLPAAKEPKLAEKLAFIERYATTLPYKKTVVLPGTEHVMMLDHAEEMSREILAFLHEIPSRR